MLMNEVACDEELDATGLVCPEPLMLVRNRVRGMAVGQSLKVIATDPSTERDIPNFCRFMGHELLLHEGETGRYTYVIRKA